MSYKVHLIIISFIIVAVYMAWQLMHNGQPAAPPPLEVKKASFSITVAHATMGKNCRNMLRASNNSTMDAFGGMDPNSIAQKFRDDNVLSAVAGLCNGKLQCQVSADNTLLGEDPLPECSDKILEVEYRCFSYDRPWIARSASGMLTINCDKATK